MVKILVVDDKKPIRDILSIFLTNNCKYKCCMAENGEEGLEVFQRESPDLIITDINMPVMDGKEMIQKIRRLSSKVPVIFMSGIVENFKDLDNIGNCDFIEKIPSLKEFSKKIKKLLS